MPTVKHVLPVQAHLEWTLTVTMAAPSHRLAPLVAPGLELDARGDLGFLAVACVQARRLRPAFLPSWAGLDFLLVGYRLFTRFRNTSGRSFRGLQVLGSETDRWLMARGGALFTHYGYRRARIQAVREGARIQVVSSSGLRVGADTRNPALPTGSPFESWDAARRYAGPMPNTFAPLGHRGAIRRVEASREGWHPEPAQVLELAVPFLAKRLSLTPEPAAAFWIQDTDYRWARGRTEHPAA